MHMNINIPALPLPPSLTLRNVGTSWWRKFKKKMKKHTKTGNTSAQAYQNMLSSRWQHR